MKDLIILAGAPGSGKSTVAGLLQRKLGCPYVDFGWMREWHLRPDWSDQTPDELEMAFDNLVYVVRNYIRHGYRNTIVCDLREAYVPRLAEAFADRDVAVVTLIVADDEELRRRVTGERDSGFRDADAALAWNGRERAAPERQGAIKVDNTHTDPQRTADDLIESLALLDPGPKRGRSM